MLTYADVRMLTYADVRQMQEAEQERERLLQIFLRANTLREEDEDGEWAGAGEGGREVERERNGKADDAADWMEREKEGGRKSMEEVR